MKTLFLGDISPTNVTSELYKKKDTGALFGDTVSLFEGNDINFVNLECAVTESENAIKKIGPPLKAVPETVDVLKMLGVTCCGVSNNHFFDYGKKGANDTIELLNKAGIEYTGFGDSYEDSRKNYVVEKNGEKICIIAVCEHEYSYALEDRMGCRPFDEFDTLEDIRNAKKENDRVIVIYHGGKEHFLYPSPRLHKACHAMAKCGADMILCQHSHCICCYEEFEGCHILYGQGNFHFVKPHPFETWYSCLAVKYDTVSGEIEFVPVVSLEKSIRLAEGEEKEKILSDFYMRNAELQNGEWKKGWHEFCVKFKEDYINAIKNAGFEDAHPDHNARFGHYLDCEAHTDVWRELFPTWNQTNEK